MRQGFRVPGSRGQDVWVADRSAIRVRFWVSGVQVSGCAGYGGKSSGCGPFGNEGVALEDSPHICGLILIFRISGLGFGVRDCDFKV